MVVKRWIEVKLPTAYMVLPHFTSCRTVSVVPVAASFGRPLGGVGDPGPAAAAARAAVVPAVATRSAGPAARTAVVLAVATAGNWRPQHPAAAMPAITAYRRPYGLRSSSLWDRIL